VVRHDPSAFVIPPAFWSRRDTRDALSTRDVGRLFLLVRQQAGASQTGLMMRTGIAKSEVSLIMQGRKVSAISRLEAIADGLDMPDSARVLLGLAPADAKVPAPRRHLTAPPPAAVAPAPHGHAVVPDDIARLAEGERIGAAGLEQFEHSTYDLARRYLVTPPAALHGELHGAQQLVAALLRSTCSAGERRRLARLAGLLNAMLGALSLDLGDFVAADMHLRIGWALAVDTGEQKLAAWVRGLQSNRQLYSQAPEHAAEGKQVTTDPRMSLRLLTLEARARAGAGDHDTARMRLGEAQGLLERAGPDRPSDVVHEFDLAQYHHYVGTAWNWVGEPSRARHHAEAALELYEGPYLSISNARVARLDIAVAAANDAQVDHAVALTESVLAGDVGTVVRARAHEVVEALARHRATPSVRALTERVHALPSPVLVSRP